MFKKLILLFVAIISIHTVKAQTLQDILNAIVAETNRAAKRHVSLKQVLSQKVVVNSASKAYFGNGKTRDAIQIELPKGTTNWYYRVTVLGVNSTYEYANNETFYYILSNRKPMEVYKPTNATVDVVMLGHTGEVTSFLQTGNNNFRYDPKYAHMNTNSFVSQCDLSQDNMWIGIRNPNKTVGLSVLVEVVSLGIYED